MNPIAEDILMHHGVGHLDGGHSGRYPWGSGENPNQLKSRSGIDVAIGKALKNKKKFNEGKFYYA